MGACTSCISKKASSSEESRNRSIITNSSGVLVGSGGSASGPSPDKMVREFKS